MEKVWMSTDELLAIVKDMHDVEWECSLLLGRNGIATRYLMWDSKMQMIVMTHDWPYCRMTEHEFVSQYGKCTWRLFKEHNTMHHHLALRLVGHLIATNMVDEVITLSEAEFVRQCGCCGRLMNEGWMVGNIETYCSEACVLAKHPEIDLDELDDDDDWVYYTAWEG